MTASIRPLLDCLKPAEKAVDVSASTWRLDDPVVMPEKRAEMLRRRRW